MTLIYKIVPQALWRAAEAMAEFGGAPVDLDDGFIHFSTGPQVRETAAKYFAGERDLFLVAVDAERLGDALKWEPSRGGDLFPHLYGKLQLADVLRVQLLPLRDDGAHDFTGLLPVIGPLFSLARPFLHALDAETAHHAALAALQFAWLPTCAPDDRRLAVSAFGLDFPSPIGLAAGFDKDAVAPDNLLALGFGFVEIGTITPRPQPGNPRPRLFRLDRDRGVINRLGFNSAGHARAHANLARRRGKGIVGVNLGANKDSDDRIADYVAGIEAFADVASYFTVNVSSPNTPGLRDLQQAAALNELLSRVLEARDRAPVRRPLLLKIAPDLFLEELDDVVRVARDRHIDGMIVSNTTVSRPASLASRHANESGGLSGQPLFELSTQMLAETYRRAEGQFPLIGVGGVDGPDAAIAKLEAGATLVQLYSALVFEGPELIARIKRGLLARPKIPPSL